MPSLAERVIDTLEDRTGFTVRQVDRVQQLEVAESELGARNAQLEDLAANVFDYFGGQPNEIRLDRRKVLFQKSRIAYTHDPLAFREIELTGDFTLGRGVSQPRAKDDEVQKVIDEAWQDPNNLQKLTGYDAQRALVVDLKTQANLFVTYYARGGYVRVGLLPADCVTDIVTDPEDRLRPLYYVERKPKQEWDFQQDQWKPLPEQERGPDGGLKATYYPHWQNVEDAKKEREQNNEEPLDEPPTDKLAKNEAKVYHLRIHRWSESQFGIPPFARSLRFFSAMNRFTETRVKMAEASAAFIARRVGKTTPTGVMKLASSMVDQLSELGTTSRRDVDGNYPDPNLNPRVPPGSILTENDTMRTESLSLNSGAGQAATDGQIIRAPIAAASGWGQHYLGDASSANLSSATTLELPALLNTASWQERFEQLFRWFTERVIEEAIKAGRLDGGPGVKGEDGQPVQASDESARRDFRLYEASEFELAQQATGRDLSYEFTMPNPQQRGMPDVVALVTEVAAQFDPQGANIPLRRALLQFLFTQAMEVEDVARVVKEVVPDDAQPTGTPPVPPGSLGPDGTPLLPGQQPGESAAQRRQYGENKRSQPADQVAKQMQQLEWIPEDLRQSVLDHERELEKGFEEVTVSAVIGASSLNGDSPS